MGLWSRLFGKAPSRGMPPEDSPLWAKGELPSHLLDEWRWLVKETFTPILCTALGDLFLQGPAGQVFRLDVELGVFRSAARDAEAFEAEAMLSHDAWWKPTLVDEARRRTRALVDGECFSWITAPGRGGARDASNLCPRTLVEHFSALGRAYAEGRATR